MKLSVIIPTRRPESAKKMVKSLRDNFSGALETVLVDEEGGLNWKINFGCRLATGDYLAILHDDMTALPGWADVLPEHGVGAFKVGELNDQFDCWGGVAGGYCTDPKDCPDYSAFLVFSRAAYADIFPVDEAYEEPGWQDNDLGIQIKEAGYEIECLPGKLVHHHERTAPLSEKNERYFKEKWHG